MFRMRAVCCNVGAEKTKARKREWVFVSRVLYFVIFCKESETYDAKPNICVDQDRVEAFGLLITEPKALVCFPFTLLH